MNPLGRAPVAHPAPVVSPTPPVDHITDGVGPLMIASLPIQAAGSDLYQRQYYRGSQVPYRRYLPINLQ